VYNVAYSSRQRQCVNNPYKSLSIINIKGILDK
jgi:hypothetical protein